MNTIRTKVSRYKRMHPDFVHRFDFWYGCYLYDCAWAEWFRSHEPVCRGQFERHRRDPALADSFLLASEAATLARMYRYSGRNTDAVPLYELALVLWTTHGAAWPHRQAAVVSALRDEIQSL